MSATSLRARSWRGSGLRLLRSALRAAGGPALSLGGRIVASGWSSHSRLFPVSDSSNWSLSWDMRELAAIARRLGVRVGPSFLVNAVPHQAAFYGSQFVLLEERWLRRGHRVGLSYFHGRPGTGVPEFDAIYDRLRQVHGNVHRIQVSHVEMRDLILDTGIAPEKLFLIPIGINLSFFHPQTPESRQEARDRLGIPASAVVVGSFQKDGTGWGEGLQPKLIKGPDVFLRTIEILKSRVPELYVLLSGPARGFVKDGLTRLGVPFHHTYLNHYPEIEALYHALDIYIVSSRQEGGPKAVLESMATGVPLVTTRVGQAMDLVRHGANGWMVDSEDAEGLAFWAEHAIADRSGLTTLLYEARRTAGENSYESQLPLWRAFMDGFVELPRDA